MDLLTTAEMAELDALLDRYADLSESEVERLEVLHRKNEQSLEPYGLRDLLALLAEK